MTQLTEKVKQIAINTHIAELQEELYQRGVDARGYEEYFPWVKRYWTSRGESLDFEDHKFLHGIYKDQHDHIIWMKSAQAGITERALTEAVWLADQFPENALYVFPTSSSISDLVQERVDDPLNNNDYLQKVSGRSKKLLGKQADKVGLKRMSEGFIYFRGSNKPTQITSVPADIIFVDEVDRMPPDSVPYIPKRLGHSHRKWQRWLSTPTLPNFGIHKMFIETDQCHYNVKCNHCNEWIDLDFFTHVKYEMKNDVECKEAWIECHKCHKRIVPHLLEGEWVPLYPDRDKRGYFIHKLYTPRVDLKELVQESLKTAEWEVQQFYNQDLGLPYSPKGGSISDEDIQACIRGYRTGVQKGQTHYMGVDVGVYLHVTIQTEDRMALIVKVKDFTELDQLMKDYNVRFCVVDALPETRKAQEFAARFRGRVFLCYYSKLNEPKKDEWFQHNASEAKVNTRRTLSLDNWSDRIRKQKVFMPENVNDFVEFKENMAALTRIVREDNKGNMIAEYVKTGPDHFYHAGNYSNIARAIADKTVVPEIFSV